MAINSLNIETILTVFLAATTCGAASNCQRDAGVYTALRLPLCVSAQYVKSMALKTPQQCALACNIDPKCRAFSMEDSRSLFCSLYSWDRCSRSVRLAECNSAIWRVSMGLVFIRSGAICPPLYAYVPSDFLPMSTNYWGYKFRIIDILDTWPNQTARCLADGDLVRPFSLDLADAPDGFGASLNEFFGTERWTGAYQQVNSEEPAGGWYWHPCGQELDGDNDSFSPVSAEVWGSEEPNNYDGENAGLLLAGQLADYSETRNFKVICQCNDPFST